MQQQEHTVEAPYNSTSPRNLNEPCTLFAVMIDW